MFHLFKKTATILGTLSVLALPLVVLEPLPARANPTAPNASRPLLTDSVPQVEEAEAIYQQAQEELPDHLYILYRVVERIARANDLDGHPWRVVVADDSLINAYATEVNLIIVHYGLLDQLAGDVSALACVVGHEMAHHTERHIAIRTSRSADWQEEYEGDAQEFQERIEELSRSHESEADEVGYRYSATAGFDSAGCLRGLEVLSRLPGTLRDSSTHPAVPRRIESIQAMIDAHPPEQLAAKGRLGLSSSTPLTFEMVEDQNWLRINSSRGGSFIEDWNSLFPEDTIAPQPEEESEATEEEAVSTGEEVMP